MIGRFGTCKETEDLLIAYQEWVDSNKEKGLQLGKKWADIIFKKGIKYAKESNTQRLF